MPILLKGDMVPAHRLAVSTLTAFCPNPQASGLRGEVVLNLLGVSYKEQNVSLESIGGSACCPFSESEEVLQYTGPVFVLHWHLVSCLSHSSVSNCHRTTVGLFNSTNLLHCP
jgi:hypothetical protein